MAKKFLLAVFALFALTMQAQVEPEVSETVELMSILSHMAGFEEYNMDMGGQYIEDIESSFASFKEHPIISHLQGLREQYGISYNAPMDLAVNLVIDGQRIKFIGDKNCMDGRWMNVDIDNFVDQLNQFYSDTRFHEFYQQHQDFYQEVLRQYKTNAMQYFHQDWYSRFYGVEPGEVFRIIIGFVNGGNNYAAHRQFPGQPKENFSVCGYWTHPQMGSILDPDNAKKYAAPTLIHEFNHSFVNPLQEIEKNAKLLGDIPERMLNQNYYIMQQQAYGESKTVFDESVVRAATIIYMMENGFTPQEINEELNDHLSSGFAWLPELVTAMRDYTSQRNKYPTLSDFYPQIAKVLNNYLDQKQKQMEKLFSLSKTLKKADKSTASINAEVMETVELMAILSRIADFVEYCQDNDGSYLQDIDQRFASFKQHPVVEYYQKLREQYGIAYDAPMSLAVRLAVDDVKIVKLQEEAGDCGLDDRWDQVNMNEFLGLLNQFYTDTRFNEFYQQHQSFYQDVLKKLNDNVMPSVHPDWLADFFGKGTPDQYKVVIGFAIGRNGFGAKRHLKGQPWDQINVVNISLDDQGNLSKGTNDIAAGLNSMFNQFSREPLIDNESITGALNEVGEKLYNMNQAQMQMNGIQDGKSAIAKSIVAAANFISMTENGISAEQACQYLNNYSTVFAWMPELVTALGDYANNRNKYRSISDFYPQLAKVLSKYLQREQQCYDKALK